MVTPGGPLTLPGWPGRHWYAVPRVGYPDPDTFRAAFAALADFHDETWERTGTAPENTVFGGFSMGSVMSYALGLSRGPPRARPASWRSRGSSPPWRAGSASLADRAGLPVFIAHGRRDPVMDVEFARSARATLTEGGLDVSYHESDVDHRIDPAHLAAATDWLAGAQAPGSA